jgi:spore coat protein U-like protein
VKRLLVPLLLCAAVSGSARAACTLNSVSGANFGNYNPLSAAPLTTVISGTFSCSKNATITISTGSSGTYAMRTMRNGANILNYNIFLDPGYTIVLGDGSPGAASYAVGAGNNQGYSLFGRAPALQDVTFGAYSDTLIVTFTF